jgi:hypothetical protein
MPAIQLSRLKIQAARLAELIPTPDLFVRSLRTILEYYSDRTHRPGQSGEPPPLLPAYNVPFPVLRQILHELTAPLSKNQSQGLLICDALWAQEQYECRLLAARVLGLLPVEPLEPVYERLMVWVLEDEERVLNELLSQGLTRWRKEAPNSYLIQLNEWMRSSSFTEQKLGLKALLPLIDDRSFTNFPVLFRLLNPMVRVAPSQIRPDLIPVLRSLAKRSPKETAFFLRQNMASQDTAWLTRKVLSEFSENLQQSLREEMKNPSVEF